MTERTRLTQQSELTLVVGATGKTGHRVVERLSALGIPTRPGSRSAATPFDWTNRASWGPALRKVTAVYISYFPDLAVPSAPNDIRAFTELAVQSGVQRLVLLSGRGEEEAQHCERLVQESGADWTIVRASWFAQNFSEAFLLGPLLGGVLSLPAGDVTEPFIDANDIADVAVAALTEDGHANRVYEVTGPRLLTFAEAVMQIGEAADREISFQQVSIETFVSQMEQQGAPKDVVSLTTYLFNTVLDGRNSSVTNGVLEALGRPPSDFRSFAQKAAASGVWNPPQ